MVIPAMMPMIRPITIVITTAIIAITRAFIQPQSKKCLIKSNQRINTIIDPKIPETNALRAPPITEPSTTIQIASVNFAFSEPTIILPASQTTKELTITVITILINKKLISVISKKIHPQTF